MNTYKIRANDPRAGAREFLIDAATAADAVTIFEYRYRQRTLVPNPEDMRGPLIPALSEPFDVIPVNQ